MSWRDERIARRYARALYQALPPEARRPAVERLTDVVTWLRETPGALEWLRHPLVRSEDKVALLERALEGADERLVRFVRLLVEHGRAALLPAAADAFRAEVDRADGRLRVRVRSARPLPERVREQIEALFLAQGYRGVELEATVDRRLIGGFVLEADGRLYDASIARALEKLKDRLIADAGAREPGKIG
ncbi:ATP synthase F1 subunit delta [Hydrogenibacillus sp. N12]|uniref:ATP synthase F1 subunit delta n=1 Tax=Hydrogenibacillus sp. N12 TaxID=2866627 RepID=UPI0019D9AA9C|nr:ATP synthase F1 subunit delta [Hydrogenibacillus sp. N12]MBE3562831.1 ATP synthase F1 subunit delta [Hydrogenibacillus schlegelii]QZA32956.1 ATP synthase F1 subunit delta [Hydrogenibacillus sp. N12]